MFIINVKRIIKGKSEEVYTGTVMSASRILDEIYKEVESQKKECEKKDLDN